MSNTITEYLQNNNKTNYSNIMDNYIQEHIRIDGTSHHKIEEQYGLIELYKNIEKNKISSFTLLPVDLMSILKTIYSKCPYPAVEFRNVNTCIEGSDVKTLDYSKVSTAIYALDEEYKKILKFKDKVLIDKLEEDIETYIKSAIRLKCKLIEIHPFQDGNGRTTRALFNYLLRQIEMPPVCTKKEERNLYISAMDKAVRNNDFVDIDNFYMTKLEKTITEINETKEFRR